MLQSDMAGVENKVKNVQVDAYRQCTACVMDTIGNPEIRFDADGVCNYCHDYRRKEAETVFTGAEGEKRLQQSIDKIKASGKGKQYDCILGVSGGVDSSYLAYLSKEKGLRPLIVHFDNGWNSELAVKNIESLVSKLGLELYTYVMNWEEFRELQRSYFKASVIDIEIPTDQLIFGALVRLARKYKIKYILSGWNTVTEATMPEPWYYGRKFDAHNLRNIHAAYSDVKLKNLPVMGFWNAMWNLFIHKIEIMPLLNYIPYNKKSIKQFLMDNLGWRDYGGKHYESIFTRFYQGYVLPVKFNVDKRKAHLSTLICSKQITKEEAMLELSQPTYDPQLQQEDKEYVAKKLGFTIPEFDAMMKEAPRSHDEFGSDKEVWERYFKVIKFFGPIKPLARKIFLGDKK